MSHKTLCTTSVQRVSGDHAQTLNKPVSGMMMPRAGGIATMMRLPYQDSTKGEKGHEPWVSAKNIFQML